MLFTSSLLTEQSSVPVYPLLLVTLDPLKELRDVADTRYLK